MAVTILSASHRTGLGPRLPGSISKAVIRPAVAGVGIRKTGCIAKSISPVNRTTLTAFLSANGKRLPITVTGEMQEKTFPLLVWSSTHYVVGVPGSRSVLCLTGRAGTPA